MNLFYRRPLATVCVCFLILSVLLACFSFRAKLYLLGFFCLLSLIGLAFLACHRSMALLSVSLCVTSILAIGVSLFSFDRNAALARAYDGETIEAEAEVTDILYENDGYGIYAITTHTLGGEKSRISLSLSLAGVEPLAIGDLISGQLTVSASDPATLSDRLTEWGQHLFGEAHISSLAIIGHRNKPRALASALNERLCQLISAHYKESASSLICAMLLGNREGLSSLVTLRFRRAGISHLLALSGMHISLLAFAVLKIGQILRIPKKVRGGILILFLVAYSLLTGLSSSILRAAIMTGMVQIGVLLRRDSDSFTSLPFAAAMIVLFDGAACLDLGLWLSVFATFGILLTSQLAKPLVEKRKGFSHRIVQAVFLPVFFTLSATLMTLPITAFFFGELSLISIPSNLVFPTLMTAFLYLALLSFPFPFLRGIVNLAGAGYLKLLALFASCPSALIPFGQTAVRILCCCLCAVVFLFACFQWKHPKRFLIPLAGCVFALIAVTVIGQCTIFRDTSFSYLSVSDASEEEFLLVHQGGKTMLCDISDASVSSYRKTVMPELNKLGENEIDLLYLSHYHSDISEALLNLCGKIYVREILVPQPRTQYEEILFFNLKNFCTSQEIPLSLEEDNHLRTLGDITLESLPRTAPENASQDADIAFTVTVSGTGFFYATADYTTDSRFEDMVSGVVCSTVILGRHGSSRAAGAAPQFPLTSDISVLLLCNSENGILLTEEEARCLDGISVIRAPALWRWKKVRT